MANHVKTTVVGSYPVLPWMVGSAVAAHVIEPTSNDVNLMFVSAAAGGWTAGLVASDLFPQVRKLRNARPSND